MFFFLFTSSSLPPLLLYPSGHLSSAKRLAVCSLLYNAANNIYLPA